AAWMAGLQERQAAARQYEQTPLARVQEWSAVPAGAQLFGSIPAVENYPPRATPRGEGAAARGGGAPPGLRADPSPPTRTAPPRADVGVQVQYDGSFDAADAERLLGHLENLLAGLLAEGAGELPVDALPMLAEVERRQLLLWGGARAEAATGTLAERFAAQVAARGEARAVVCAGSVLTYGELDRRAERLAARLRGLGVCPEVRVGLRVERSLDLVIGILGIVKAGGAYVPLDPAYPRERLAWLVADSGAQVV